MTDDPWHYDKLSVHHPELKHLPAFLYGNYYSLLHWSDGTLNGHWINTLSNQEYIDFFNYMKDQFPFISDIKDSYRITEALKNTNEEQQVYLKMNWGKV